MASHCGFRLHLLVSKAAEQAPPHVLTGETRAHLLCGDVYLGFGHLSGFFFFFSCGLQKYSVCLVYHLPGLLPLSVAFIFSSVCF